MKNKLDFIEASYKVARNEAILDFIFNNNLSLRDLFYTAVKMLKLSFSEAGCSKKEAEYIIRVKSEEIIDEVESFLRTKYGRDSAEYKKWEGEAD